MKRTNLNCPVGANWPTCISENAKISNTGGGYCPHSRSKQRSTIRESVGVREGAKLFADKRSRQLLPLLLHRRPTSRLMSRLHRVWQWWIIHSVGLVYTGEGGECVSTVIKAVEVLRMWRDLWRLPCGGSNSIWRFLLHDASSRQQQQQQLWHWFCVWQRVDRTDGGRVAPQIE